MKVADLIEKLEGYNPDMMVRSAVYDTWGGSWRLSKLGVDTLFTDETGGRDLTDQERDRDIETLILY